MIKTFYRYEFGYINLDSENLYLTSSGNWSEAKKLEEKSTRIAVKGKIRSVRIWLFFIVVTAVLALIYLLNLSREKMSYGALFIIPFIIYKLYKYLQHDLGPRYRIPLDKIDAITPEQGGFMISFRNRDNIADSVFIRNVKAEIFLETARKAIEQKLLSTKA